LKEHLLKPFEKGGGEISPPSVFLVPLLIPRLMNLKRDSKGQWKRYCISQHTHPGSAREMEGIVRQPSYISNHDFMEAQRKSSDCHMMETLSFGQSAVSSFVNGFE
jgi:hypothetical protein